jgi:hypothetical protein
VVLSLFCPHRDEENNIFLGEASYRFIRIPVNQKSILTHVKERAAAELLEFRDSYSHCQKFMVRKYKDRFFHRLVTFEVGVLVCRIHVST